MPSQRGNKFHRKRNALLHFTVNTRALFSSGKKKSEPGNFITLFVYFVGQGCTCEAYDTQRRVRLLIDIRKYSTTTTYSSNIKLRVIFHNPRQDAKDKFNALYSKLIHVQDKPSSVLDLNFNSIL